MITRIDNKASIARVFFVYWLFDDQDNCLYVGCTRCPRQRWDQHRVTRKDMVVETAHRRMSGPYTFAVARRIEREQQDRLTPKYDRRIVGIESARESRERSRPFYARLRREALEAQTSS